MKCSTCLDGLYKRIKKEVGKDNTMIEVRMKSELSSIPDGITNVGHGWPRCLKHWIEDQGW